MKTETSCGAVIYTLVNNEPQYVLIESLTGAWGFPKGHVEPGETEEQTALREIREEVGLQPTLLPGFRLTDEYPLPEKPGTTKRVIFFCAACERATLHPQPEELKSAAFLPYEETLQRLTYDSSRAILQSAHDFIRRTVNGWQIRSIEPRDIGPSLALVESVFTAHQNPREGQTVRRLVEEIRAKKYYLPELELLMTDAAGEIIGYAMFSRFHIEGRYESELLLLSPVAVRTDLQRQHISKMLIEEGFRRARAMGYQAVLVEGNPRNYQPRGFEPSWRHGVVAGPGIHLPHPDCLMVKELNPGALADIHGEVDYSFYDALQEESEGVEDQQAP